MNSKMKSAKDEPKAKWIRKGENVLTADELEKIEKLFEEDSVIVEHKVYYGA